MAIMIDSGPLEPTDKFTDTPKDKWRSLLTVKRLFLATNINYDCRCLVEFVDEAEEAWEGLGYESAEDMIRNGYKLDPVQIELAVAWLRHNDPESPVSLPQIEAEVKAARENPLLDVGPPTKEERRNKGDNITITQRGTSTSYTLRRLARDGREDLLGQIERGETSVNAAAVSAGYRKKPTPEESVVKSFRRCENRLKPLRLILRELDEHERRVILGWLRDEEA